MFNIHLDIIEYAFGLFYLAVIFLFAFYYQTQKIKENPEFVFFTPGLVAKILGGLLFTFIYYYYYKGGDTLNYFHSAKVLTHLFVKSPDTYFSILFGNLSPENWSQFDANTGYPLYFRNYWAFSVVRFTSIFVFFGAGSLLGTVVLLATISFIGIWYFYRFAYHEFPRLKIQLAIAILFYPSVIFWGSGILKDTFTLTASVFSFLAFYKLLIYKKKRAINLLIILISLFILLSMKPYIFFIQSSVFLILIIKIRFSKINSLFLRVIVFPVVILLFTTLSIIVFNSIGEMAGGFYSSTDDMLKMASVKQEDLTKEYYGGNTFNIGYFNPTVQGVLSKFIPAVNAGFFRPYLWEANNIVMLISGAETFILLVFFLWVGINLIRILLFKGPRWIIHFLFSNHFVFYALFFSLFFSFVVGLTTANFGALVRYKIPFLSYFLSLLFILNYYIKKSNIV